MTCVPSWTWRTFSQQYPQRRLPRGVDAAWEAAVGSVLRYVPRTKRFMERAKHVLELEATFASQKNAQLRMSANELHVRFRRGRESPPDLLRAFALIREVAFRQIGERPFLNQVAGGLAMEAGCIAEMATGEGKTLAATMPAVIAGWRGRGCHVVTLNDYLAGRDSDWMSRIYQFCGLRASHIEHEMSPTERREAYKSDVTYCTNKELAADFLRDCYAIGPRRNLVSALLDKITNRIDVTNRMVQRGLASAIVDEADSILIDEAVTPLIIAGGAPNLEHTEAYQQAARVAARLQASLDYRTDYHGNDIQLTTHGRAKLAQAANDLGGVWAGMRRCEELVVQSLHARNCFHLGKQYVIDQGKIAIVDEFTGRLMPDRTWRDGLHQAIEAKEKLQINPPDETLARISFQRFFHLYPKLSGMTGTAMEAVREFWHVYRLPVVEIPTNRPCIRKQLPDRTFASASAKWQAVVADVRRIHEAGRPILVGTRSVRDSEYLSGLLAAESLDHQVLSAVRHAEEAQIVAGAGQLCAITVATNMAGRGTDIKLAQGVTERGGLHVIATELHESKRIDRQLYGRAGRQGDPGSGQAFVSLEDELVRRYTPHLSSLLRRRFAHAHHELSSPSIQHLFACAQRRAQRLARRQRVRVLNTDNWLDEFLSFTESKF